MSVQSKQVGMPSTTQSAISNVLVYTKSWAGPRSCTLNGFVDFFWLDSKHHFFACAIVGGVGLPCLSIMTIGLIGLTVTGTLIS